MRKEKMNNDIIIPSDDEKTTTKPEYLGRKLIQSIYKRDVNAGGSFTEISSAPGAGKTALTLSLGKQIIKRSPNELVYFSSAYGSPLQFFRIPHKIYVQEDLDLIFWNRNKEQPVEIKHIRFKDFEDLYNKSSPGVLCCPFFGSRENWMNFTEFLLSKRGWKTVLIDEISEVAPAGARDELYKKIEYFAEHTLTQARKCFVTVIGNTQVYSGTHWKVRRKLNNRIYLPGAIVESKVVRVWQKSVDNLREDHKHGSQAYICSGGRYGIIECKDVITPLPGWSIDVRVENLGDNNGKKERETTTNTINKGRRSKRTNNDDKLYKWKNKRRSIHTNS